MSKTKSGNYGWSRRKPKKKSIEVMKDLRDYAVSIFDDWDKYLQPSRYHLPRPKRYASLEEFEQYKKNRKKRSALVMFASGSLWFRFILSR